jgi:hypothetical protein
LRKILILQSNYIPWRGYFDLLAAADEFVVYDDVQYTKNDWRNRNKIKTMRGSEWITIPVFHSLQEKINEVKVSDSRWNLKHWSTIQTNYGKAPFFKHFKERFEDSYRNRTEVYLSEINLFFIKMVVDLLNIKTRITLSADYEVGGDKTERLVSICKKLNGSVYISGPSARNYLQESLFVQEGIQVSYFDYTGYTEYPQLFPPFEPALSILDLLFNCGPEAKNYLKYMTHSNPYDISAKI